MLLQRSREEPQSDSLSVLRSIERLEIKTTERNQIPAMYKRYALSTSDADSAIFFPFFYPFLPSLFFARAGLNRERSIQSRAADARDGGAEEKSVDVDTDEQRQTHGDGGERSEARAEQKGRPI